MTDLENIQDFDLHISYSFSDFLIIEKELIYALLDDLTQTIDGKNVDKEEFNDQINVNEKIIIKIIHLINFISKLKTIHYYKNNLDNIHHNISDYYEIKWELRCFLVDLLMKNIFFFNEIYNTENEYNDYQDKIRKELIEENNALSFFIKNNLEIQKLDINNNFDLLKECETINQKLRDKSTKTNEETTKEAAKKIEATTEATKDESTKIIMGTIEETNEATTKVTRDESTKTIIETIDIQNSDDEKQSNITQQSIDSQLETEAKLTDNQKTDIKEQQFDNQKNYNDLINSQNLRNIEDGITNKENDHEKQQINDQNLRNTGNSSRQENELKIKEKLIDDHKIVKESNDNQQLNYFHDNSNNPLSEILKIHSQSNQSRQNEEDSTEQNEDSKEQNEEDSTVQNEKLFENHSNKTIDEKLNEIIEGIKQLHNKVDNFFRYFDQKIENRRICNTRRF